MKSPDIVETYLDFAKELSERGNTDMIVIHYTGEPDMDASAETIHGWHLANDGWAGIGYHFVVRKDGTIERGRPEWAIGSHAYGENSHTLGIHVCGGDVQPTDAQIEKTSMLIAYLCDKYGIPIDRDHIVGHGELMPTSCPGTHLQALLDDGTLTGKACFYLYGAPKEQEAPMETKPAGGRMQSLADMPDWAKPTIKKLIDKGILGGNGAKDASGNPVELDLSLDMIRILVMNDRAGVYDGR